MQSLQCLQPSVRTRSTSKNHSNFLPTKRHETTILMQLGGKYFGWEKPEVSEFEQINAVTAMLAGYKMHKRYNKMRLREQIWLTERYQCISLMELGSKESKKKKQETF